MGQAFLSVSTPAAGTLLRHDMQPDRTGWTVHDVLEGRPVCLAGISLVGLSFEEVNELVDVLNRQELEIELQPRQLVAEAMRPRSQSLRSLPVRAEHLRASRPKRVHQRWQGTRS